MAGAPPVSTATEAEASSSSDKVAKGVFVDLVPNAKDFRASRRMCERLHPNVEYQSLKNFVADLGSERGGQTESLTSVL